MKRVYTAVKNYIYEVLQKRKPQLVHTYNNTSSFCKITSKQYFPSCYGYLTFIGLRSNNNEEKDKEWVLEEDVHKYISLAEIAIKAGNLQKAEIILQRALSIHEPSKTTGVTCIYEMLATLAFREGNHDKARELLEKVIDYLKTTGLPLEHNKIIEYKLKLARVLSKLGETVEADNNFRQCLDLQKLKDQVGVKDEEAIKLRINCLYWYGRHLCDLKKFFEAKTCFDTAYTLTAKVKTIEHQQVMVILFNLSDTLLATGDIDGAVNHLLTATILGRMTNSSDLPLYYTKLGTLYLRKGLLREARHWCEHGRDRAKTHNNKQAQTEGDDCLKKINEALKLAP